MGNEEYKSCDFCYCYDVCLVWRSIQKVDWPISRMDIPAICLRYLPDAEKGACGGPGEANGANQSKER